jgi:hypothetical protein
LSIKTLYRADEKAQDVGSDLAFEYAKAWYWTGETGIYSVIVADIDADASTEIVTGGYYYDGSGNQNAQLVVWSFE